MTKLPSQSDGSGISVAIHQPNYLPWTPWWQKMVDADMFVIMDDVQIDHTGFTRKSYIHGQTLSVPIKSEHHFSPINQVEIDHSQPWRRKHSRALHFIYARFPKYRSLAEAIMEAYNVEMRFLISFNMELIRVIRSVMGIETPTILLSGLHTKEHGGALIREILDKCNASRYITGSGWAKYIPIELMKGIEVKESSYADQRPILDLLFGGINIAKQ